MNLKTYFATIFIFILFAVTIAVGDNSKFEYLDVNGNTVTTTHKARYKIDIAKSFRYLGKFNHQPTFDNKSFNVSVAAFAKGESVILIHAETHTDGSRGLDFSKLKAGSLSNLKFNTRVQCIPPEAAADLADNAEVNFLTSKHVAVSLPFYMKQFLATNAEGTAEVIVSYGTHVVDCDSNTAELDKQIEQEMQENIKISKIN